MYVCMYACMYECMHACIVYVRMYACMYVCMYVCMYELCMHVCMHVCMYACMYVCMYVRMHVCFGPGCNYPPFATVAVAMSESYGGMSSKAATGTRLISLLLLLVNPATLVLRLAIFKDFGPLYLLCAIPALILYATNGSSHGRPFLFLLNPCTVTLYMLLADSVAGAVFRLLFLGPNFTMLW